MFITGILLTPTILADATTDLTDLKTIVNSAATAIGAPTNSSRNWGSFSSDSGSMGTAQLVQNITGAVLKAKYNIDTDKVAWVNQTPVSHPPPPEPSQPTITDLYLDYIATIPNLSSALTALGRAWHWEMNSPVYTAIGALEECLSQFSTSLLEAEVLETPAVLKTIRASSSLETAQQAWGRMLNLPGTSSSSSKSSERKREVEVGREPHRFPYVKVGSVYTHKELWGRKPKVPRGESARMYHGGVVIEQKKRVVAPDAPLRRMEFVP